MVKHVLFAKSLYPLSVFFFIFVLFSEIQRIILGPRASDSPLTSYGFPSQLQAPLSLEEQSLTRLKS